MFSRYLLKNFNTNQINVLSMFISCILTFILLKLNFRFLPRDKGRAYAVNGELSKGKKRGVGIIITFCYVLIVLLFYPIKLEGTIFSFLLICAMIGGYLEDA